MGYPVKRHIRSTESNSETALNNTYIPLKKVARDIEHCEFGSKKSQNAKQDPDPSTPVTNQIVQTIVIDIEGRSRLPNENGTEWVSEIQAVVHPS
jgi:hypothetical protein